MVCIFAAPNGCDRHYNPSGNLLTVVETPACADFCFRPVVFREWQVAPQSFRAQLNSNPSAQLRKDCLASFSGARLTIGGSGSGVVDLPYLSATLNSMIFGIHCDEFYGSNRCYNLGVTDGRQALPYLYG
jgi:hypothetical protein